MTQEYVQRLVRAYPSIAEIWLLGSRANGMERPDSDWDYVAFGDDASALNQLHNDPQFNDPNVDLLFLGPGVDEAIKPWPSADNSWKKLGLGNAPGGIKWKVISATEASYTETKDRRPGSFEVDQRIAKAKLIYRRKPTK
jgi:hypothetical protein